MVLKKNEILKSPNMALLANIMEVYQNIETKLRNFLKPYGISLQQYNVLKILKGSEEPLSTSVIRERMIQPMTDSSRLVKRLCAKGWVQSVACNIDKRLVDVTISEEGRNFLSEISNMDAVIEELYKKITNEEALTLNHLLDKMRG